MNNTNSFNEDEWGLEPKDFLSLAPVDFDLREQLKIIHAIFHRNREATARTIEEIHECERDANRLKGSAADQAVDDYGVAVHWAIYEDAAHGMSAVALLAPLFEGIMHQCLLVLGSKYHRAASPKSGHIRWSAQDQRLWDCHWVWQDGAWRKNVYAGSIQLLEALDLLRLLPSDYPQVYRAIVAYRNLMFHHGLEWPVRDRIAFRDKITSEGWPKDWFEISQNGSDPWMFSLTTAFVDRSIQIVNALADVFGSYVREKESTIPSP